MTTTPLLRIDGAVARALDLTYTDLDAMPETDRVLDVSRFHPKRRGDGVSLDALLRLASPRPEANFVTLHAGKDDFHVSIPLAPLHGQGVVVYRVGDRPLGPDDGGPIRLIIRDPSACHTGDLDECANVKFLDRIELTERKGRDTRPADEAAHQALHEK
jgi:DMSO/TMAO reductase YedYZ molybdopterin-dependent catalytic subunit